MCWFHAGCLHEYCEPHKLDEDFTLEQRRYARECYKDMPGSEVLFVLEADKELDAESEPEEFE